MFKDMKMNSVKNLEDMPNALIAGSPSVIPNSQKNTAESNSLIVDNQCTLHYKMASFDETL